MSLLIWAQNPKSESLTCRELRGGWVIRIDQELKKKKGRRKQKRLYPSIYSEKYGVTLDVSVDDSLWMEICQGLQNRLTNRGNLLFIQPWGKTHRFKICFAISKSAAEEVVKIHDSVKHQQLWWGKKKKKKEKRATNKKITSTAAGWPPPKPVKSSTM